VSLWRQRPKDGIRNGSGSHNVKSFIAAFKISKIDNLLNYIPLDRKFITFLLVGTVNTAFSYLVFVLLFFLGFHYSLATFLAIALGILFNFKTTGRLVFQSTDNGLFFKFFSVYLVLYLVNTASLWAFNQIRFNLYYANAIMTLPMAFMAFCLHKKFVFKKN
jgi:putative flippase GtrA